VPEGDLGEKFVKGMIFWGGERGEGFEESLGNHVFLLNQFLVPSWADLFNRGNSVGPSTGLVIVFISIFVS
jgi:hypothetical protein